MKSATRIARIMIVRYDRGDRSPLSQEYTNLIEDVRLARRYKITQTFSPGLLTEVQAEIVRLA